MQILLDPEGASKNYIGQTSGFLKFHHCYGKPLKCQICKKEKYSQSKGIYDSIDLNIVKWIDVTRKKGFVLKNLVEELGRKG